MTAVLLSNQISHPEIIYPSSDGEPLAESYDHLWKRKISMKVLVLEAVRADREAKRIKELELQVALYQKQLGELPVD